MMIKLSTLLLLSCGFLACTDKSSPLRQPTQQQSIGIHSAIQSTVVSGVFEQQGNKNMQVTLGKYTFNLPDGWRDTSSYLYKAKDQSRALTVSFGKTRDNINLEQLVSQRRQQLTDTMGDEVEFLSQEKGMISILPAIYLSFRFGDKNKQYLEYWATAFYAENKYIAVSYVGPQEDKSFGVEFKHIMATSLPISQPEPEDVAAQYVWRQAHILRFQAPVELKAPRHYTYVSSNGITLKASFYNPGESWPDNSVADDTAKDLRFGGTQGKLQDDIFGDLSIQQLDAVFQAGDPLEPTRYKAHRAHIAGLGGRLHLFVRGFESQSQQVDEFWQQLMTSLIAGRQQAISVVKPDASNDAGQPL